MAGRKAITTIVAILLAVMLTLAVSLSAFLFIQRTQKSAQGVTESSFYNFMQRASSCVKLVSFKFNPVTNISEMVIKNCGFREIDLGNENLHLLVKAQDKSCSFTLNSTNCANCVGKLSIGSFVMLQINASAVYCASTLADLLNTAVGQTVEVILFDKISSFNAATTFIPTPIVVCGIGLSPSNSCLSGAELCFNYTLSNIGNAQDVFSVYDINLPVPNGPVCSLYNTSGCTGSPVGSFEVVLDGSPTGEPPYDSYNYSVFLNFTGASGIYKEYGCQILITESNCNRERIETSYGKRTGAC